MAPDNHRHTDELIHGIDKKLEVLCSEFASVKLCVLGNGRRGLIDRIAALENWRWYIVGIAVGAIFVIEYLVKG